MFYALKIIDDHGYIVTEHVSNTADDVVHTEYAADLPQTTWSKAQYLIDFVKKNRTNWEIVQRKFPYTEIFESKF